VERWQGGRREEKAEVFFKGECQCRGGSASLHTLQDLPKTSGHSMARASGSSKLGNLIDTERMEARTKRKVFRACTNCKKGHVDCDDGKRQLCPDLGLIGG